MFLLFLNEMLIQGIRLTLATQKGNNAVAHVSTETILLCCLQVGIRLGLPGEFYATLASLQLHENSKRKENSPFQATIATLSASHPHKNLCVSRSAHRSGFFAVLLVEARN